MRMLEMQRKRSIAKQQKYYDNLYEEIIKSKRKIKNARLRRGLYKKLYEEFKVLLEYTKIRYKDDETIRLKWVGEEQQGKTLNYDGEIYIKSKLIGKIEITCPLICKKDNDDAKELNQQGYTTTEVGDLQNKLEEIRNQIKNIANKKNSKKTYDNTITLLIYMEDYKYFFEDVDICDNILKDIKRELQNIAYQFKEVYLLKNINGKKELIKIY